MNFSTVASIRILAATLGFPTLVCLSSPVFGQVENPVQKSVQEVTGLPSVAHVEGEIVPLIWKATIDGSVVSVPLRHVEYFGIQNYDVDGATRVRELTIAMRSQSLVRIYHIRPLSGTSQRASDTINRLRQAAEGVVGEELDLPVKVFPQTTHAHMVEYRVSQSKLIDDMYQHLEAAMADYHARELIREQRPQTIREIKVAE